jgi:hypothetical protein
MKDNAQRRVLQPFYRKLLDAKTLKMHRDQVEGTRTPCIIARFEQVP